MLSSRGVWTFCDEKESTDAGARQGCHRRSGDRRLQRSLPPRQARVAGHRGRRAGAPVRDRRLDLTRARPRFPDQPVEDDDRLRPVHGGPVDAHGAGRRAVRQGGGQHGGGLDARAARRPETEGRSRHELGRGGPPHRPRRGARQDTGAVGPYPWRHIRPVRHPHEGHEAGGGDGAGGGAARGRVSRRHQGRRLRHRRRADHLGPDHPGRHQDGPGGRGDGHLGSQGRPAGRRAHPAVADAAPVRRYDARAGAGRRDRGGVAADPAPPGQVDVLPAGRRVLRHRLLPARAAAGGRRRHPRPRAGAGRTGRDDVHACPLRGSHEVGGRAAPLPPGRGADTQVQRDVLLHDRRVPRARRIAPGQRDSGRPRPYGSPRRREWGRRSPNG